MNTQHIDFESLVKDARWLYQHLAWDTGCPSEDVLYDLAHDELSSDMLADVSKHVNTCQSCRMQALKFQEQRDRWDLAIDAAYEAELLKLRHTPELDYELPEWSAAVYYYDVEEARVANTAFSRTFEKTCPFSTPAGTITVDLLWGRQGEPGEAFLWMQWEADFPEGQKFAIRFVELNTEELLFEFVPDNFATAGQNTFEAADLPFDPSRTFWKPGVVLSKGDVA